ncbi:MAG: amidohydrolase family protein, partial [Bdellovibrionota bacterium]|nr:amidohydrolase family protein [Bdellovibrionota bacterium]
LLSKEGVPYLIHAEIDEENTKNITITKKYQTFLDSRPRSWENRAIELMGLLSEKYNCKVHIVHLSSSDLLPFFSEKKKRKVPLTVETCPHYLLLASEKIPDGKTLFKCCPPIREDENRLNLWKGVKEGIIDFIVSDHSPCIPQLKLIEQGDLEKAWGGISSLQFSLPLIWTEGEKQGLSPIDLVRLLCKGPSELIGLEHKKGDLLPGMDADIIVWSPQETFELTKEKILYKHKISPYEGKILKGEVQKTYLRGNIIYDNGQLPQGPKGQTILKSI